MTRNRPHRTRVGCFVVVVFVALFSIVVGASALSLQSRATRLQQMAIQPSRLSLGVLTEEVRGARREVAVLRFALTPMLWLGARLGGDLGAAEPLMGAALESLVAGDESLAALASMVGEVDLATLSMADVPRILDGLSSARPMLDHSADRLDAAQERLSQIRDPLSPRMERWVEQAQTLVSLARQGIDAARVAPQLLGKDAPRTYLVLVQNSDEIRATGGFISTVGRVTLSYGKVITQTFEDSYAVDDFSKEYPDPPAPLLDYMSSEQWVFRDANWSPDFPTTGRDAIYLYQIGRPGQIDGVIGINLKTIQILMPGLEPLQVEGFAEPVTAENVIRLLQEAWNPNLNAPDAPKSAGDWIMTRKRFASAFARAAMDKVLSGKANWSRLGLGTINAIRQRQITLYIIGQESALVAKLGWDGALLPNDGDYLMVVDSNIGYSKANAIVSEQVDYRVSLAPSGTGRAVVTITYMHQGKQSGVICTPQVPYDASITYEKMIHRCYLDYLRLYVPPGSKLRTATAHLVPGEYLLSGKPADGKAETLAEEVNRTVFGQFFVVEYGKQLQTRFEYDLPVVIKDVDTGKQYTLSFQKQSGTDAMPVKVILTLPPGAQIISAVPSPTAQTTDTLEFALQLDSDQQVRVIFAPGR